MTDMAASNVDTISPKKRARLYSYLAARIGICEIASDNITEVWARVFILESALGTADLEPQMTFEDIRRHVGLAVPDGDRFGSAEFMKRVGNRLRERAFRLQCGRPAEPRSRHSV